MSNNLDFEQINRKIKRDLSLIKRGIYSTSIKESPLSNKVKNALARGRYVTVLDLFDENKQLKDRDLMMLPNFGIASLTEVINYLQNIGYDGFATIISKYRREHPWSNPTCEICGISLVGLGTNKGDHLLECHKEYAATVVRKQYAGYEVRNYKCLSCGEVLVSPGKLIEHYQLRHSSLVRARVKK